ncbi:MAG: efflux RND transporter periplasmic adaptor subunit [Candidatus Sulfobium sp.]|jgi:multidrug efflux system membrane fusion protein
MSNTKNFGLGRVLGRVVVVLVCSGAMFVAACAKKTSDPPRRPPAPVTVAKVLRKTVPVRINAIGNVEAYSTINVKSQIGGQLVKVHFREGQDVKKGDLLFTIDPRPYEAQVKQAEAALAKDTAQMEYAHEEARRYEELVKKGYAAKDQYDQFRANAAALDATVKADKASLDNAKLQLTYCYIYSPITGRTGALLSNEGNLIKANADTAMVTIQQVQPIYVDFSVPEQYLPLIKKYMAGGKLKVQASPDQKGGTVENGLLTFVDNSVDASTGTIKLKGTFENRDRRLWPGQFINVALTLTQQPNAIIVPASAVNTGQDGEYVFVVKDDHTVEQHPVKVDRTFGDESIIEKGLDAGETVVTDGQLRLGPGAKVVIKNPAEGATK